jgi:hypothetical protein
MRLICIDTLAVVVCPTPELDMLSCTFMSTRRQVPYSKWICPFMFTLIETDPLDT